MPAPSRPSRRFAPLLLVTLAAPALPALAQNELTPQMFYVAAFGGLASPENMDAHDTDGIEGGAGESGANGFLLGDSIVRPNAFQLGLDESYYGGLAVGRDFGVLRVEIEGAYRPLKYARVQIFDDPLEDSDGEIDVISLMGNLYLDVPVTSFLDVYVGGGIGLAYMESRVDNEFEFDNPFVGDTDVLISDGNDVVWAFQAMAGVAVHLGESVTLSGGVRYFTTADPQFDRSEYNGPDIPSVELGLRFNF